MNLTLRDVEFAYPGGPAVLRGVDFSVAAGEFVCLLGPNGSGKSTLLRCAAGLARPRAGSVTLDGVALADLAAPERARRIAYLPQSVPAPRGHRVRAVVELGRHPHHDRPWSAPGPEDARAVDAALAATETTALAERNFETLSGGERQRVLLASALAQGGELLLLDEPTTALDLHHQIEGMRRLRDLADAGRAVACATHDLNLAANFATRLVLLAEGRVVSSGDAVTVLQADRLREVYGEGLWVGPHPQGDVPVVLPERR